MDQCASDCVRHRRYHGDDLQLKWGSGAASALEAEAGLAVPEKRDGSHEELHRRALHCPSLAALHSVAGFPGYAIPRRYDR